MPKIHSTPDSTESPLLRTLPADQHSGCQRCQHRQQNCHARHGVLSSQGSLLLLLSAQLVENNFLLASVYDTHFF
jgi:hypothetical protein